jgi:hypothetical protein
MLRIVKKSKDTLPIALTYGFVCKQAFADKYNLTKRKNNGKR